MRISSLNIWPSFSLRKSQQEREVKENSNHSKIVWDVRNHKGWGNSIQLMDWESRRLVGWTTPLPKAGDELLFPMQSGRIGRFRFKDVNPCTDPSDMWFATMQDLGYED